jgi:hypothetical protein
MANTIGEKELKTDYPVEEGLDISKRLKGRTMNLVAEEGSLLTQRQKAGLDGRTR